MMYLQFLSLKVFEDRELFKKFQAGFEELLETLTASNVIKYKVTDDAGNSISSQFKIFRITTFAFKLQELLK